VLAAEAVLIGHLELLELAVLVAGEMVFLELGLVETVRQILVVAVEEVELQQYQQT
jgi:hypothetical protein